MNGTESDFITVLIAGAVVVGIADALLHRVRGRRYRGRTYDPTRPVIQRAGAQRVGFTGRMCDFCGVATFGWSDRCGKCHRLPVRLPKYATEQRSSTSFLPSVPAESSSVAVTAAAPRPLLSASSLQSAAGSEVTGVGGRTRRRRTS